ncbi:MAG: hypothetical protein IJA65_03295 [Acholeplasmatales bacterium]|nr:hypothetical protein [Acholeplasmatales bacterium]
MIKRYKNYNDYELLYLITEGNRYAYDILFNKYDVYIYKIASTYIPYGDKKEDLIQEGRLLLFNCIKSYKDYHNISFFSYFSICLKRAFNKLYNTEYYKMISLNEDITNIDLNGVSPHSYNLYKGKRIFDDELEIEMYDDVILGNLNLRVFADNHNITYSKAYYIYTNIISKLKTFFSIDL